ncbi:MAG: matrixin family metalloprotease [Pseudomonadota bacterium]|nr:matrixin family metalloprotease [Pseudomonadota bacterium]
MKKKTLVIVFLAWIMVGFRIYSSSNPWNISVSAPRLWVKWCATYPVGTNDLDSSDPLFSQAPTFQQVVDSIYNDYNQVPGSYVELYDAATDPTYNASAGAEHTIDICLASLTVLGGKARPTFNGGKIVACDIVLSPKTIEKLSGFVRTVTHEIGHCLGFDHPQEITHSVMSYFAPSSFRRLQVDDKMGLVYLYPVDPNSGKEKSTFGLSCSPSE